MFCALQCASTVLDADLGHSATQKLASQTTNDLGCLLEPPSVCWCVGVWVC